MSSTEARILCLHSGHVSAMMLTTLFRGILLPSTATGISATGTCCKYADLTVEPRSRRNNKNMQKPAPHIKSTSVPILPFCCLKYSSVATCKLSMLRDKSPANIQYTCHVPNNQTPVVVVTTCTKPTVPASSHPPTEVPQTRRQQAATFISARAMTCSRNLPRRRARRIKIVLADSLCASQGSP